MGDMKHAGTATERATLWHDLRGPLITIEGFVGEIDRALVELETLLADDTDSAVVKEQLANLMADELRPCLDFVGTATRAMHGRIDALAPAPAGAAREDDDD